MKDAEPELIDLAWSGWFGLFQRGWRPAFAWELLIECTMMAFIFAHEVWTGDYTALHAFQEHEGFFEVYFGFRFGVLGILGAGRTVEKVAAINKQSE